MLQYALLVAICSKAAARTYCSSADSCWPTEEWTTLSSELDGSLHTISDVATVYDECAAAITAYGGATVLQAANGTCIFAATCVWEDCDSTVVPTNLPVYSVEALTVNDVQSAVNFARTYSIKLSVKTTGASYSVADQQDDSLLIWMSNFEKYSTDGVSESTVICDTEQGPTLRVGGGETWGDVFNALAANGQYMMSSGAAVTVGGSGGWLQGGGLGPFDRSLGLGVDNVVEYEVVTADGTAVTANACTNPDLFWALRGGGGGNWGVVTGQTSKVHPIQTLVRVNIAWLASAAVGAYGAAYGLPDGTFATPFPNSIGAGNEDMITITKNSTVFGNTASDTIDLWHDAMVGLMNPATMDERIDGYYGIGCQWGGGFMCADLYFRGDMSEFQSAFLTPLQNALELGDIQNTSTFRAAASQAYVLQAKQYSSYYDYASTDCTDSTPGSAQDYICNTIGYPSANGYDADVSLDAGDYQTRLSWMVPASLLTDTPDTAKELFKDPYMSYATGHVLGGVVNSVGTEATAVHPGMRSTAFELLLPPILDSATDDNGDLSMPNIRAVLEQYAPLPQNGPIFNHDARNLAVLTPLGNGLDWQQLYWQDNLERLQQVKAQYDPTAVFTCRDCVTVAPCAEDEYVDANVCTPCPTGTTNIAGDDPSGEDTACDSIGSSGLVDASAATLAFLMLNIFYR